MTPSVVSAEDLGKSYRVFESPWQRLLEAVTRRPRHRRFQALSGVSFELPRGEGLGVVGENGAGKSTLLKMIAGIVAPSEGRLRVDGRVASILELGSSFHPEFTGRQNIVLNAAMLGLTQDQVREKTPEIIAFSELGDFIDQPVKVYSSGMSMRLGFAIATVVEPDVLIIDEALSVGDGYFQKKCMDRLRRFLSQGGTLLFCSHAMYYVSAFCNRVLWLRRGEMAALGETEEVVRDYESFLLAKTRSAQAAEVPEEELDEQDRPGPARLTAVRLVGGEPAGDRHRFRSHQPLAVEVEWESAEPDLAFHLGLGINRLDEVEALSFATHLDGQEPWRGAGPHRARLEVPDLPLLRGRFTLYVFLLDEAGLHVFDRRILQDAFEVESSSYVFGLFDAEHRWTRSEAVRVQAPASASP